MIPYWAVAGQNPRRCRLARIGRLWRTAAFGGQVRAGTSMRVAVAGGYALVGNMAAGVVVLRVGE